MPVSKEEVDKEICANLVKRESKYISIPWWAELLLSTVTTNEADQSEIKNLFDEFFASEKLPPSIPEDKTNQKSMSKDYPSTGGGFQLTRIKLSGNRRINSRPQGELKKKISTLYFADTTWLYYFDEMGVFKLLEIIIDDFSLNGKLPIPIDNIISQILEPMVLLIRSNSVIALKDRSSLYRRCLGWSLNKESVSNGDSVVTNTAFRNLFYKLISFVLSYYKDRRVTEVISSRNNSSSSVETLSAIQNTIRLIRIAMEAFSYGRNFYITLHGIVLAIFTLNLVRQLRDVIGIPSSFRSLYQYFPAAHDILVSGKPITPSETNRYEIYSQCAIQIRRILLDLEVLDFENTEKLKAWLDLSEDSFESYRASHRILTGRDLIATSAPEVIIT